MATNPTIKLEDVYFYFTNIAQPVWKYQSKTEKEYTVQVAVSKAQAKEFKALGLNKTVKAVETSEFEAAYKTKPPYPDYDEQLMISVTQNVSKKDGTPLPDFLRPLTYIEERGKVVLSTDTLVGNGSKGDLRFTTLESLDGKKPTVKLHSILVKELIKYEKKGDEWASAAGVDTFTNATPATNADEDLLF